MDAHERLKKIETEVMEQAIAQWVSEKTGWRYTCNIGGIEYGDLGRAQVKLTLETLDWLNVDVKDE